MAHHQQQDSNRRQPGLIGMLKMFTLSNAPTVVPLGDDELAGEVDEPPDDQGSPLSNAFTHKDPLYSKALRLVAEPRRESMLTRAILGGSSPEEHSPLSPSLAAAPRGFSTTSSHSNASITSAPELTSDSNPTTPLHSATSSPHFPTLHHPSQLSKLNILPTSNVTSAPLDRDAKPADGEAAIEKTLGRKRCIMFACGGSNDKLDETVPEPKQDVKAPTEPPKRKCMLTFACPSRANTEPVPKKDETTSPIEPPPRKRMLTFACPSRSDTTRRGSADKLSEESKPAPATPAQVSDDSDRRSSAASTTSELDTTKLEHAPYSPRGFHEFASSHEEPDAWIDQPIEHQRRLTVDDCMKKEYAIRQLGQEAEEEADEEDQEAEDRENEVDEEDNGEDDFAPSDESSDGGNESDDENGFADSDDESDAGSDYQFWAPASTTAATSTDNMNISHFSSRQRSTASSAASSLTDSGLHFKNSNWKQPPKHHLSRGSKMRPGTPELPDSTDFVCGTLDEDRPLEAAYISCRELRKREKHIPIPQDIDPSFPTTDPDDNDDDDDADDADDHLWLKDQLNGFEEGSVQNRRRAPDVKSSPRHSPAPVSVIARPAVVRRGVSHRSPPPKHVIARSPPPKHTKARSPPPPRRLFGHSPHRLRSPPPRGLKSPPGSPTYRGATMGLATSRLAQRPGAAQTSSLPRTPNPFFHNYRGRSPPTSTATSAVATPGVSSDVPRTDMHVRGPVDIVIGLEKKRQKRKEKFWRQHCRKAAKENAERRIAPGRGAERMKELGLECAERNKGYGLGQQTQLVISL